MRLPARHVSHPSLSALSARLPAVVHRLSVCPPGPRRGRPTPDHGQTTAEYGLVILAAGTLALAAILWARSSGSITDLFQSVIDQLTGNVGG